MTRGQNLLIAWSNVSWKLGTETETETKAERLDDTQHQVNSAGSCAECKNGIEYGGAVKYHDMLAMRVVTRGENLLIKTETERLDDT